MVKKIRPDDRISQNVNNIKRQRFERFTYN